MKITLDYQSFSINNDLLESNQGCQKAASSNNIG